MFSYKSPNVRIYDVRSYINIQNYRNIQSIEIKYSNNKYRFECNLCKNDFERSPHTLGNRYNNVCPFCRYKTEYKLYDKLKPIYQSIIRDFKQDWCKKINNLPFDFCITENKIIIELITDLY